MRHETQMTVHENEIITNNCAIWRKQNGENNMAIFLSKYKFYLGKVNKIG